MATGNSYNKKGVVVTSAAPVEVDIAALSRGATFHSITADGDSVAIEYSHLGSAYKATTAADGNNTVNISLVGLTKVRLTSAGSSTVYISGF